jgi:hypothetical protein
MPLGDDMVGMAGNFTLPDEVLAALPKDPSEQLYLAWHIKAMVVAGWVSELEWQPAHQRAEAMDKDHENGNLGERVMLLDVMPQETNARLHNTLEDTAGFHHMLFASNLLPAQGSSWT